MSEANRRTSVDMKLLLVHHVAMMFLMVGGWALPLRVTLGAIAALWLVLPAIAIAHRVRSGWRWRGVGAGGILGAVGTVLLGSFFLGGAVASSRGVHPGLVPWLAAGAAILVFGCLSSLRLAYGKEEAFLADCGERDGEEAPAAAPREALWRRTVRGVYGTCFLAVWIAGVASFWPADDLLPGDRSVPTAERTEVITQGKRDVHVTPVERKAFEILGKVASRGIPVIVLAGFVLFPVLRKRTPEAT